MTSAIKHWKSTVKAHNAQSLKIQEESSWSSGDFWLPLAPFFKADPHRTDDPVLNRLWEEITPGSTALDVGGGGGRYALPLALHCEQVTVVDPSVSMIDGLRVGAQEANVSNLSIVPGLWEEVEVDPADVVLCANVVYDVAEIEPFIRKLEAHAKDRVFVLAYMESPLSQFSPCWKVAHGEKRVDLPAMPELLHVLWDMDIYPNLETFPALHPETVRSRPVALELLRQFLFVKSDTEPDRLLQTEIDDLIVETPQGFTVRGSRPRRLALLSWSPKPNSQQWELDSPQKIAMEALI